MLALRSILLSDRWKELPSVPTVFLGHTQYMRGDVRA